MRAIQGLPALGNAAPAVPHTPGLPAAGRYTLAVGALANFAPGTRLTLRDQLLGTATPLTAATRYAFGTTATAVAGRFFLELAPAAAPLASAAQLLAAGLGVWPNPAHAAATVAVPAVAGAAAATLALRDALGRTVRTATATLPATGLRHELPLNGLAPGVYTLHVRAGAASAVRRLVVE